MARITTNGDTILDGCTKKLPDGFENTTLRQFRYDPDAEKGRHLLYCVFRSDTGVNYVSGVLFDSATIAKSELLKKLIDLHKSSGKTGRHHNENHDLALRVLMDSIYYETLETYYASASARENAKTTEKLVRQYLCDCGEYAVDDLKLIESSIMDNIVYTEYVRIFEYELLEN